MYYVSENEYGCILQITTLEYMVSLGLRRRCYLSPSFRPAQSRRKMKALDKCVGVIIASLMGTYLLFAMRKVEIDTVSVRIMFCFIPQDSLKLDKTILRFHQTKK